MKIVFLQLPLIDHSFNYIDGNIPYAPATLIAYIKKNFKQKHLVEYTPVEYANFISDRLIIKYLMGSNPEIIAFTNYLWNAERNLKIAKQIKKLNPQIKNIFGGPEINNGSFLFKRKYSEVDIFYIGEGEWFFKKFLNSHNFKKYSHKVNNNLIVKQPENELLDVEEIIEPFNANILNPMYDGSIFLEQTRGCPYKCSYCFYSKNNNKIREKGFDLLINSLKKGKERGLKEIYLLCPTFNRSKDFKKNLLALQKLKHNIALHTEMRTDNIDFETAKLISNAGFISLEVGLQTITGQALKKAGRTNNIENEIIGIQNLKRAGLEIKIGIIPGLPGDTPAGFKKTIKRLLSYDLGENIELYSLMILPGTKILLDAKKEQLIFQKKPPYYLQESETFKLNDLLVLKEYLAQKTGYFGLVKRLPDFTTDNNSKFYNAVFFNGDINSNWNAEKYNAYLDTNVFIFKVKVKNEIDLFSSLKLLFFDKRASSELYNLIFYSTRLFKEEELLNFLNYFNQDNFYRRINLFESWLDGNRIQFYQIVTNLKLYLSLLKKYQIIIPLFRLTAENYKNYNLYKGEIIDLVISADCFKYVKEKMVKQYKEYPEKITFENSSDLKEFYESINLEFIQYSISFNCKNLITI